MENIKDDKALSYAVDLALKRYDEEQKRTEGLNNRSNNLLGYTATLSTLYFGMIASKLSNNSFLIGITFFVFFIDFFVIVLCLWASNVLLLKKFVTGPGGKILNKSARDLSENGLKSNVLTSYTNAYDYNYKQNMNSSTKIRWASILFAIGCILASIGFITQFFTSNS